MCTPPAYKQDVPEALGAIMRQSRLATLVTATAESLVATPLPLFLDETEGPYGTLYGHLAKANSQWRLPVRGEALALFSGPDAYITPSWYATKQETGKSCLPGTTWRYTPMVRSSFSRTRTGCLMSFRG